MPSECVTHCIPIENITSEQISSILPGFRTVAETIDDHKYWLVNDDQMIKINAAGYQLISQAATSFEGLMISRITRAGMTPPTPVPPPEAPPVEPVVPQSEFSPTITWEGHLSGINKDSPQEKLTSIGIKLRRNISIHGMNGARHDPIPDTNYFYIWVCSSPNRGKMILEPKIFGYDVDQRSPDIGYWDAGRPVYDDDDTEIAAVDSSNLFIYHPVNTYPYSDAIFIKTVEAAIKALESPVTSEEQTQRLNKNFIKYCSIKAKKDISIAQTQVTNLQTQLEKFKKDIIDTIRDLESSQARLDAATNFDKSQVEKLTRELSALMSTPRVKKVKMRGNTSLQIYTDNCYCIHPKTGVEYDIGEMRFVLNIETGMVKIFNMTRRVDAFNHGMHAPHVFADGRPCYGNLDNLIPDMLGRNQFSAIASVLISFIESVNLEDNAGAKLHYWPISTRNKGGNNVS